MREKCNDISTVVNEGSNDMLNEGSNDMLRNTKKICAYNYVLNNASLLFLKGNTLLYSPG